MNSKEEGEENIKQDNKFSKQQANIKINENMPQKFIRQRHNLDYIIVDIFSGKYTDNEGEIGVTFREIVL